MRTGEISRISYDSPGFGSGEGDCERIEYNCPCGSGKVIEEHDNIPGFRDHQVYLFCKTCNLKYELDTSKGTRYWELKVKKSFDTIKLDLYENAIDSFIVAIDSYIRGEYYPKYYKIAIKEMFSAFELMLKDILSHEHESLIYSKVEDFAEPIHKRHSVNYETLINRLEKLAGFKIDENYNRLINKLRTLRNLGMHSSFEINRLNAADIISSAVPVFVSLHRRFYGEDLKLSVLLGVENFKGYLKIQMAMKELVKDAKKRFDEDGRKTIKFDEVIVKCIECNSEYIVHKDNLIKCYCCHEEFRDYDFYSMFIKYNEENFANDIYECPNCNCYSLVMHEPYDDYLCLSCGLTKDKINCSECNREFPVSEVDDITDYSVEIVSKLITYQCYDCKNRYDDFE